MNYDSINKLSHEKRLLESNMNQLKITLKDEAIAECAESIVNLSLEERKELLKELLKEIRFIDNK